MKWYNIFLLLLITQLTACGTTLFRADFDSDAVGEVPRSSPPGEPADDRIWVASTESDEARDAAVVISDGIDGKSLRYSNLEIPSLFREVHFFPQRLTWTATNIGQCGADVYGDLRI